VCLRVSYIILPKHHPIAQMLRTYGGIKIPFGLMLFNRFVQPLQGCLNILIYTRPHVNNARKVDQDLGYLQALKQVILSGCDSDGVDQMGLSSRHSRAVSGRCKHNIPRKQRNDEGPLEQNQDTNGDAKISSIVACSSCEISVKESIVSNDDIEDARNNDNNAEMRKEDEYDDDLDKDARNNDNNAEMRNEYEYVDDLDKEERGLIPDVPNDKQDNV